MAFVAAVVAVVAAAAVAAVAPGCTRSRLGACPPPPPVVVVVAAAAAAAVVVVAAAVVVVVCNHTLNDLYKIPGYKSLLYACMFVLRCAIGLMIQTT